MSNWFNDGVPFHKFDPDCLYDEELPIWIRARKANGLKIPQKVINRLNKLKQPSLF